MGIGRLKELYLINIKNELDFKEKMAVYLMFDFFFIITSNAKKCSLRRKGGDDRRRD